MNHGVFLDCLSAYLNWDWEAPFCSGSGPRGLLLSPLAFGVPLASILSPMLFNFYTKLLLRLFRDMDWAVTNIWMAYSTALHFQLIPG